MNNFRIVLLAALFGTSTLYAQQKPLRRLAVISDVHLMAPTLLQKEGKAFDEYIANDRKMLTQSVELLDSVSSHISFFQPQAIFITGDLTKDGEKVAQIILLCF